MLYVLTAAPLLVVGAIAVADRIDVIRRRRELDEWHREIGWR